MCGERQQHLPGVESSLPISKQAIFEALQWAYAAQRITKTAAQTGKGSTCYRNSAQALRASYGNFEHSALW